MSLSLRRRIERLEATMGGEEVTLEELVLWSYAQEPFDAETQRRHDDFARRSERSKLCRLIEEAFGALILAAASGRAADAKVP